MDITENKLQQLIIEELKEVLGMDQEYTGSEMDLDAENDLSGALVALQKAGYSRQEVLDMVDDAYDYEPERVQEDFFSDSAEEEGAEAKQRAAQGETTGAGGDDDDPGEYVTTSENCGCPSCPEHGSGAKIRVKVR